MTPSETFPSVPGATTPDDALAPAGKSRDDIVVIVVNYGSSRLIDLNLTELDSRVEIIVVDNLSDAAEREAVGALARRRGWRLVAMGDNGGFARGVNAGVKEAMRVGYHHFLLLNPDARVSPEVVDALRRHSVEHPMALIAPRIASSRGPDYFVGAAVDIGSGDMVTLRGSAPATWRATTTARDSRIPWVTAACVAFSRELYDGVGPFDEDYFLYWEDVDFSYRCYQAGASLVVRRDLTAVHDEGGTQRRANDRSKSARYYFYSCRNRLLFGSRHLDRRSMARWILRTPSASWKILLRGGRRQIILEPLKPLAAAAGTVVGLGFAARAIWSAHGPETGGWRAG